ncbi:peptidase domain-containing ABC transporter [Pseudanabaenaceae cyanobacterium LEGE 13415]|nr:peptidase domain-containing ABC transporter [Pseudanabaenaceae cyanobacterium LEGE 13415]
MTHVNLQVQSFLPILLTAYPFNRLSPAAHQRLGQQVTLNTFQAGQVIADEGELPSAIHCVVQEQVRIVGSAKSGSPTLRVTEPGDVVGWESILRRRAFGSIRAVGLESEVLTLSISADDFETLMHDELLPSLTEEVTIAELYDILLQFISKIPVQLPTFDLKVVIQHLQDHQLAIARHWFPQNGTAELLPTDYVWFVSGGAPVSVPVGIPIKALERIVPLRDSRLPVRLIGIDRTVLATVLTSGTLPVHATNDSGLPREAETVIALLEGLLSPKSDVDPEELPTQSSYPIHFARSYEMEEYSVACFWMVCDYLKIPYRPDVLRRWFTKFPTLPSDMLPIYSRIAEAFGLRSQLVELLPTVGGLGRLQTPALVIVDNIPCVLYEVTPRAAILGSPATGLLRLSPNEVSKQLKRSDRKLTHALLLERQPMSPVKRFGWGWFLPSLQPHRAIVFQILVASVFVQLLALANPLLTQQIIDKAIINGSADALPVFALLMLTFTLLENVLTILRTYLLNSTTNRIDLMLGTEIVRHLLNLPLNFFQKRPVGELATRISELENIRQFLTGTFLTVLLDVLFCGIYIAMMLVYSVPLTLCVLGFVPIVIGITLFSSPLLQKLIRKKSDQNARMQSYLIEILNGIFTMKSQSMENLVQANWRIQYLGYLGTSFRTTMLGAAAGSINNIANSASSLVVLWVGGSLVLQGNMTVGGLIAFRIISGYVTGPLVRLSRLWQKFQETNLSMELLADVVDTPTEIAGDDANLSIPQIRGQVKYEAVNFSFPNSGQQQLTNINLEIPSGTFIGLVGQSGSGKSTLLKLLPRFYLPSEGTIYLDGYDISKVSLSSLRHQLGVVPQDPVLFEGTIRDNITSFAEVEDAIVMQAAKIAEAHQFIMELPNGYSTRVGERGSNLSGGQRQRIALARMIVSNPQLVILDEATSALDYETEHRVCQNLREHFRGKTLFFITHRLANLVNADLILYLQSGTVVEQGTHAQLIAKRQRYYSLFTQQA